MSAVRCLAWALLLAAIAGCVSNPISRDVRQQAKPVTYNQVMADPEGTRGTTVIWGGRIVGIDNDTNGGILYILYFPLQSDGSPRNAQNTPGRFMATSTFFLDPDMFPPGSVITVAGQLNGVWTEPLENVQYTYPVVNLQETHVWQERPPSPSRGGASWSVYVGPTWYWSPGWGWYNPRFHGPRGPPRGPRRPPPGRRGPPPPRGAHWR